MTEKLKQLFNLPEDQESSIEQSMKENLSLNFQNIEEIDAAIDKIDSALPIVKDLDTADGELDNLSDFAKKTAEELISLGMNVEARYSGTILQTAGVLLGHAITAKQAKIDKKLRMIDLQLKKLRIDQQNSNNGDKPPIEANATVIDRNELLKTILASKKS